MNNEFVIRHADKIRGVLSCFDRVVIYGTIPDICYGDKMAARLRREGVQIFDYTKYVEPMRQKIRDNAESLARENGLKIEFLRWKTRKEARVREILKERGEHPGLVHIFSAMEACTAFKPQFNKKRGSHLKAVGGKCLHYYFYFIVEGLGLCYLRVPTWAPFRLQFYFNGYNHLAAALDKEHLAYQMLDNSFVEIEDFERAQELADELNIDDLHALLDLLAHQFCPVIEEFTSGYHWSLMQVEYATDIVFKRQEDLAPIYDTLTRTAIHAVKAENIATFLGRKLTGNYQGEVGNDFQVRIEGTRIKHHMGRVSIKMYDKRGIILRVETTANDVSFFKHYRKVEHRDGTTSQKYAPVRKTIYSLGILRGLLLASNRRYIDFLAALDDPSVGFKKLEKISRRVREKDRTYPGFNLFDGQDLSLLRAIVRGEFAISGFQNRHLRTLLPHLNSGQVGRHLKRLRTHGLIKKIGGCYKYYLTKLGRKVITTALKMREMHLIPALATA